MDLFGYYVPFNYLVIGLLVLFFASVPLLRRGSARHQAEFDRKLEHAAKLRRWSFATQHDPRRLKFVYGATADGWKWTATSTSNRRTARSEGVWTSLTRWKCDVPVLRGEVIEIWPYRGSGIQTGIQLSAENPFVQLLFRPITAALEVDSSRTKDLLNVQEWKFNGPLDELFAIRATNPATADKLFDHDLREALLEYGQWTARRDSALHGGALIFGVVWDRGIEILARWADVEGIEQLTRVGTAIRSSAQKLETR